MSTNTLSNKVPTYQAIAQQLKRADVKIVFGLMSDDTALLLATLDAMDVRFVSARHENMAIAMAEGYATATNQVAVAIIGRGPALTNGLHAAVYANRSGAKVLLIYGESNQAGVPMGPDEKRFDATGVLSAAGFQILRAASPDIAPSILASALSMAKKGNTVALLLPLDVQRADFIDSLEEKAGKVAGPTDDPPPRPPSLAAAASLLQQCRKPIIIAGLGAYNSGAGPAIESLAKKIGGVLLTSLKAKDMFRDSPHNLGIIGSFSHSVARRLIDDADCILVFGASLNKRTTSLGMALPTAVPVIHVDTIRSKIGQWFPADIAIVADARVVAERLSAMLSDRAPSEKPFHDDKVLSMISSFDPLADFEPASTSRTIDPRILAIELDKLLPKNRNFVYDMGNFIGVMPYISVPSPSNLKFTGDFASIGLGFGTALGFAAGRENIPTVLMIGDGGFLMTLGELETTIREDIPLCIVVMNDCAYGAEAHFLKSNGMSTAKAIFPDLDFAPIAEGFGFQAFTIRTLSELRALAPILAKAEGPILLDCKINASISAPFINEGAQYQRHRNKA
jgi:acetolactate synthase I/II/III large subunit